MSGLKGIDNLGRGRGVCVCLTFYVPKTNTVGVFFFLKNHLFVFEYLSRDAKPTLIEFFFFCPYTFRVSEFETHAMLELGTHMFTRISINIYDICIHVHTRSALGDWITTVDTIRVLKSQPEEKTLSMFTPIVQLHYNLKTPYRY